MVSIVEINPAKQLEVAVNTLKSIASLELRSAPFIEPALAESYEADYKEDAVVAALGLFDQVIADAQTQLNLDSQAPKVLEVLQYLRYEALNA